MANPMSAHSTPHRTPKGSNSARRSSVPYQRRTQPGRRPDANRNSENEREAAHPEMATADEPEVTLGNGETQNMIIEAVNAVYANRRATAQGALDATPPNTAESAAVANSATAAKPEGLLTRNRAAAAAAAKRGANANSSPSAKPGVNHWGQTGKIRAVYRKTTRRFRESQPRHNEVDSDPTESSTNSEVISETEDENQVPLLDVNHFPRTGDALLSAIEARLRDLQSSRAKDQQECERLLEHIGRYKEVRHGECKKVREACAAIEQVEASLGGMEVTLSAAKATIGKVVGSFITRT